VPEWLDFVVARLHEKSPDERFASAGEVAALLEQCLAHVQQPTVTPLPKSLRPSIAARPLGWRRRLAISGAVLGVFALASGLVWQRVGQVERRTEAPEANAVAESPSDAQAEAADKDRDHATDLSDVSIAGDVQRFDDELRELERRTRQAWGAAQAPPGD
jgi:hypothetical protein